MSSDKRTPSEVRAALEGDEAAGDPAKTEFDNPYEDGTAEWAAWGEAFAGRRENDDAIGGMFE